jgi:hypothetical protein
MTIGTIFGAVSRRLLVGGLIILGVIAGLVIAQSNSKTSQGNVRPAIHMMTSLPLRWSEVQAGQTFDLKAEPSPAFKWLQQKQGIKLLDNFDTIPIVKVLFLAQPRAFSPAELVVLDDWVRKGGRVLILADPALAWESSYPLGDRRRPLFTSLLSPLLAHWGVDLVLKTDGETRDIIREIGGHTIRTQTLGGWVRTGDAKDKPQCKISESTVIASCKIGAGQAILLADADLLFDENWQGSGLRYILGQNDFGNLELIQQQIDDLHR